MKKYPEVNLVIEELVSEQIIKNLGNDLLDVGILVTPLNDKSIVEIPLFYEKFVVYMSTNHPLSSKAEINFKDLDINEMWLLKEGHCFRNQAMNICGAEEFNNDNQLRFESGSLETLRRIVEKQYGYTLLPELAMIDLEEKRQKYIKTFDKVQPIREVSLVIHRSYMKQKLIELLKVEILDNIPQSLLDRKRGKLIKWA